jgi:hypothetical protein
MRPPHLLLLFVTYTFQLCATLPKQSFAIRQRRKFRMLELAQQQAPGKVFSLPLEIMPHGGWQLPVAPLNSYHHPLAHWHTV